MGRVSLTAQHQLAAVPDPAGLEIPVLQRDPLPLEAGQQLRPAPVQKAGAPHRPGGLQKDPEAVEVPQGALAAKVAHPPALVGHHQGEGEGQPEAAGGSATEPRKGLWKVISRLR